MKPPTSTQVFDFRRPSRATHDWLMTLCKSPGHAFRRPLLRAARAGHIGLLMVTPGPVPVSLLDGDRPLAVVLNDGGAGPDAFTDLEKLLWWASAVVVHGAPGYAHEYANVAKLAQGLGRLVLIETRHEGVDPWMLPVQAEWRRRMAAGEPRLSWTAWTASPPYAVSSADLGFGARRPVAASQGRH